jgi:hypothetical protein
VTNIRIFDSGSWPVHYSSSHRGNNNFHCLTQPVLQSLFHMPKLQWTTQMKSIINSPTICLSNKQGLFYIIYHYIKKLHHRAFKLPYSHIQAQFISHPLHAFKIADQKKRETNLLEKITIINAPRKNNYHQCT